MKRSGGWRSTAALLAAAWSPFILHSCTSPVRVLDPVAMADLHAAPRIQVGLGRFLRVAAARPVFEGTVTVHGAAGVLARLDPGPLDLAWEGGLKLRGTVYPDAVLRLATGAVGEFTLEGVRYRGDLLVLRDDDRETRQPRLTLVNEVGLEDYLQGVVGKEMSLSAPVEALKAQVIAARTYAWYEAQNRTLRVRAGEKFDVYDDERSQVYGGRERETDLAIRLVSETRGRFLTYRDRVFKTFFASTCGGHTEPATMMLGEGEDIPPLRGAPCGNCSEGKYYRWTAELPRAEVVRKLFGAQTTAKLQSVTVTKTMPGGHALEVIVRVENSPREYRFHANDGFRRRIDPRTIRSTLFESIEVKGEKLLITGRGWGHAVGMCQIGAYKLASQGRTASEILEFYYPQSVLTKTY